MACAIPDVGLGSAARAIPIDMSHCPTPRRPGKRASQQEHDQYRQLQKKMRISAVACQRIAVLRRNLDAHDANRPLLVAVDGAYTNNTVFRNIPQRTVVIGRIRKDAKLYEPPPGSRWRLTPQARPTPSTSR